MATTNLISKSLGDILTESGDGTPDHTSPKGSIYVDKNTGTIYQNKDNGTIWLKLNTVAYGEGYYQNNTTQTTITTLNTWVSVANTFTSGLNVGFSVSTNTLTLLTGYDGDYEVKADVTLSYVGGTDNYEVGISLNGATPVAGTYNGTQVNATFIRQHVGVNSIMTLAAGDTLRLAVRDITSTNNVIVRHAELFVRKVG